MQPFGDQRDWFLSSRWGLFLHFGVYAIEGFHEQDQMRRRIPHEEYEKLLPRFNPVNWNPDAIIDLCEEVGMTHLCLTTKHHDGFCLWDTDLTDFKVTNTPYGKDLVGELAEACHRRNFNLGLYYSVVDWRHPAYPNQGRHHEIPEPRGGGEGDWDAYMEFLRGQVRELLTRYGTVRHWFWDMNVPEYEDPSVNAMMRELQPEMVINRRGFDEGDFGCPERDYNDAENKVLRAFPRRTEVCNSVGRQSWGYRENEDYYADRHLIQQMDEGLAKGGNYLLNVGPKPDGSIPEGAANILRRMGQWYASVRDSFIDAEPEADLTTNNEVLLTRKGKDLFVHIPSYPAGDAISLQPIQEKPKRAVLLNTGVELETRLELLPSFWSSGKPCLRLLGLPVEELANEVMVVKLEFDRLPEKKGEGMESFVG